MLCHRAPQPLINILRKHREATAISSTDAILRVCPLKAGRQINDAVLSEFSAREPLISGLQST